MLREKDVVACRAQHSQALSLSAGSHSQTSATPRPADLRTEKQGEGVGGGQREKTAETEKLRNNEMRKRGGMESKESGPGNSNRSCVCLGGRGWGRDT